MQGIYGNEKDNASHCAVPRGLQKVMNVLVHCTDCQLLFSLQDDSIVQAVPRQGLVPPSRFMKKPQPVNAIKLEDLEKELTGTENALQQVPEGPKQTPRKLMIGQPPPGIPRPMMTPPGFHSPAARMVSTGVIVSISIS